MRQINIKNPGSNPYLTAGNRIYMIGSQNGLFPDMGEHIPKEMWGIWSPPIKLMDGFWLSVNGQWLEQADLFTNMPYGNQHLYEIGDKLDVKRFQFAPDDINGLVIQYTFTNKTHKIMNLKTDFLARTDLMPVWLTERLGKSDGKDYAFWDEEEQFIYGKDELNPWYLILGTDKRINTTRIHRDIYGPEKTFGKGISICMTTCLELEGNKSNTITYFISGSHQNKTKALQAYFNMRDNHEKLLKDKIIRYEGINEKADLVLESDLSLKEMYDWTKYNNDWMIRDIPQIGRGMAAGFAEFPWWFGHDSAYSLPAMLMMGDYEICRDTLRLIKDISERINDNGRVIHEISTNGVVFYEGRLTETPQFADIVWRVYLWSGDMDFLREMYPFCKKGMEWLYNESCPDKDGLPIGYGVTEIERLDIACCDTAVHALRGCEVVSKMAGELGLSHERDYYNSKFHEYWQQFQKAFWIEEEGLYGDMVATPEQIIERIILWKKNIKGFPLVEEDGVSGTESCKLDKTPKDIQDKKILFDHLNSIMEKAENAKPGVKKPWILFGLDHTILPIKYGYITDGRAIDIMDKMWSSEYLSEYGAKQSSKMNSASMPIITAHRITAEGRLGRADKMLEYMKLVEKTFGLVTPGTTSEICPDKGCFVQAWNSYGTMWPFANGFFGLHPNAYKKLLVIKPCFPKKWDEISLLNIKIGNGEFDFHYKSQNSLKALTVYVTDDSWEIKIDREFIKDCKFKIIVK